MTITNTDKRYLGKIRIDTVDWDLNQSRWSLHTTGYARRAAITFGGAKQEARLHRIIGGRIKGRPLTRLEEVDHIDGNPLNNLRSNLRICTHRENMRNQQNRRRGVSGFIGVSPFADRWRAYLVIDNQQVSAGIYRDPREAAWMRDQYAMALHGEFARLNFTYVEVA